MRVAGALAAEVLEMIAPHVREGVSTEELNTLCHEYIVDKQAAVPAPLNYHGFPKSICTSVNHVVCHGIPGERMLKSGDVLNIDITVISKGGGTRSRRSASELSLPTAGRTDRPRKIETLIFKENLNLRDIERDESNGVRVESLTSDFIYKN